VFLGRGRGVLGLWQRVPCYSAEPGVTHRLKKRSCEGYRIIRDGYARLLTPGSLWRSPATSSGTGGNVWQRARAGSAAGPFCPEV